MKSATKPVYNCGILNSIELQEQSFSDIMECLKKDATKYSDCKKKNRKIGAYLCTTSGKWAVGFNVCPEKLKKCVSCDRSSEKPGEKSYKCKIIHAEIECIFNYLKNFGSIEELKGATMIVSVFPCNYCLMILIHLGFGEIVYCEEYYDENGTVSLLKRRVYESGVKSIQIN